MADTDQPTNLLNVVLFEPEIPPNTGNIIRLCANTGIQLHLIEPVAFELDDKRLRRAGLDYGEWKDMLVHSSWQSFLDQCQPQRLFAISTKGRQYVYDVAFQQGDFLVFGPETRGLPQALMDSLPSGHVLRIPMLENSRSMNLSNAVSVVVYEGWRQMAFSNAV